MRTNRVKDYGDESHYYASRVKTFDTRMENREIYKGDTAYEDDYRFYVPEKRRLYKWPKDKSEMGKKIISAAPIQYDQQTYRPFKEGAHVPFNLFWDPIPITGTYAAMNLLTNKDEIEEKYSSITEAEHLESNRTKARVILSPAIKLDGIENNDLRTLITTSMYDSDWKRAVRVATDTHFKVKKTYPGYNAWVRNKIHFVPNIHPVVHSNFRRKSRSWDNVQVRETVDPTAKFWLNKNLKEQDVFATEKLVTPETKQQIKQLIIEDNLRTAHDLVNPLYEGFYPRVSYGVSLEKKDLPVTHPNISVSQALTIRYAKDHLAARKAQWEKWGLQ